MQIRLTQPGDIPALQTVLDATELFPSDMLPDIIAPFLAGEATSEIWLTCEKGGTPVGFCYAEPEELAEGTWNMRAIAVSPPAQGSGCGKAITQHLEDALKSQGARILIADTSGTEAFAQTRAFYAKAGYAEEARIRDFWGAGDDKVVFWKPLT